MVSVDDGDAAPDVTIVIPTLNGMRYLPSCLASAVDECAYLPGTAEILVVDNGSTDGTREYVRREVPEARLMALNTNHGFAEACDLGISAARGTYCLLLNNDAWFASGALGTLLDAGRQTDCAFVGPMIVHPNGRFQSGPMAIDCLGEPVQVPPNHRPFFFTGAALLVRKQTYVSLGGFDRRLFAFHEEIDLQWRAQLRGLRVGYAQEARIYHVGGATVSGAILQAGTETKVSRERLYLGRRNQLAILLMNHSAATLVFVLPAWLLSGVVECAGASLLGHQLQWRVYAKAIAWNIRNLGETIRRHRMIQSERVVSHIEMFRRFAPPFLRLRTAVRLMQCGVQLRIDP